MCIRDRQNLYEHTWRVPYIVKGPGIGKGKRTQGNIYLMDTLPTICEMAGIGIPHTVEGKSFLYILEGSRKPLRDTLYGVYCGGSKPGMRSIRIGDWKLVKFDVLDGAVRETQLFNLAKNPHEFIAVHGRKSRWETNLAEDPRHAKKRGELESALIAEMKLSLIHI